MSQRDNPTPDDDAAIIQAGYRYALSLTHNRHDAEDLIQQACLQLFSRKGQLVGKRYLFVTIRNAFYDRCRQRGTETASLADEENLESSDGNHEDAINDRIDIEVMLGCLRAEERELLFLTYVEGYTAAEIAELTSQPRGTILSQISRAKSKLIRRYGNAGVMQHGP